MEDVKDERRVLQCSIEKVGACELSRHGVRFRSDRDESSTINFCSIGYSTLVNRFWPEYLMRDF